MSIASIYIQSLHDTSIKNQFQQLAGQAIFHSTSLTRNNNDFKIYFGLLPDSTTKHGNQVMREI